MKKVLLLGANSRAGLTVCRSLGRKGIHVDLVRLGEATSTEKSIYVKQVFTIGDPWESVERFTENLSSLLTEHTYDLMIPIDDSGCQICIRYRAELEKKVRIALPDNDAMVFSQNKERLLELCEEIGIPYPYYVTLETLKEVETFSETAGYPLYVKPVSSARIIDDRLTNFRVEKVHDAGELQAFCRSVVPDSPVMAQLTCEGFGVGLYVLASKGKLLSITQQNRIHEPPDGGGSSYRMTVPVDPTLKAYTEQLIARTGWTGVAMVEFKGDPDLALWNIMEINGRFWGSLPLTVSSGLDYPFWLYRLYEGTLTAEEIPEPVIHFRQRNLKKDVGWIARKVRSGPRRIQTMTDWTRDFKYVLTGQERFDVESLKDPLPAIYEWGELMRDAFGNGSKLPKQAEPAKLEKP